MKNKKGFTLIELLVVVLIIGILAAVALPQYQYAVYKARYVQLRTLVDSIVSAQMRHRLATGSYTIDFDDLDIQIPDNGTITKDEQKSVIKYSKFTITMLGYNDQNGGTHHDVCIGNIPIGNGFNLNYYHYYPRWNTGARWRPSCRCNEEKGCKICEKLGGVYSSTNDSYMSYIF